MTLYTPPTVDYGFPTGNRLLDRLTLPRGQYLLSDGAGGWITVETPYAGLLEGLTEGVDYFIGGHLYDLDDDTITTLPPSGDVGGGSGGGGSPPPPPPPPPGGGNGPIGYGVGPYGEDGYGT